MWMFTGYILYKLYGLGRTSVGLDEPVRFVFGRLWGEHNVVLNDSLEELYNELELLSEHGYVELAEDRVILKEQLGLFKKPVEESPLRVENRLYEEYLSKINAAAEAFAEGRCNNG